MMKCCGEVKQGKAQGYVKQSVVHETLKDLISIKASDMWANTMCRSILISQKWRWLAVATTYHLSILFLNFFMLWTSSEVKQGKAQFITYLYHHVLYDQVENTKSLNKIYQEFDPLIGKKNKFLTDVHFLNIFLNQPRHCMITNINKKKKKKSM